MSASVDDSPPLHDPLAGKPHPESKLHPHLYAASS